jgi:hypothetical protein
MYDYLLFQQITGIFREGPIELVHYTFNHWNNKLKKEIESFNKEDKKYFIN